MKVLLISHSDAGGGAGVAALRLAAAMRSYGVNVSLGVVYSTSNNEFIFKLPLANGVANSILVFFSKILRKSLRFIFNPSNPVQHSTNCFSAIDVDWINLSDFDVVNLHWINFNAISIKDIARIKKPIVWTLHDCWPFCGAEHIPNIWENDQRFIFGYSRSNKPGSTKGIDLCRLVWKKKKRYWKNVNITFVAPSRWISEMLGKSNLFSGASCNVIPNIIPSKIFKPKSAAIVREIFGIPNHGSIIGFGAAGDITNSRSIKGGNLLLEALKTIENYNQYTLLIIGPVGEDFKKSIKMKAFYAGNVENEYLLSALYSCCDVFVVPSVIENLSTMSLEAISCGIPVAAFNTGGNSEIIEHKKNGYLAPLFDSTDLAHGINYCIANKEVLSKACLTKAKDFISEQNIVEEYERFYEYTSQMYCRELKDE